MHRVFGFACSMLALGACGAHPAPFVADASTRTLASRDAESDAHA